MSADTDVTDHESQIKSLTLDPKVTRRMFAGGSALGAGFALAVQPVSAATILTDANGLTAGMVTVPVAGRSMPAFRARPAGKTNEAVVIVIHEIFGVHEHIKDLCRRLAKEGYYAIAPDMFSPYGDATKIADMQTLFREIVGKLGDDEVVADMDACVAFARGERADAAKLAVTGFCWGGRQTWMYTARNPNVRAGAAWYGQLVTPSGPGPTTVAANIKGRVLGLYGGKDNGIPMTQVDAMRAALKAGGDTRSEIIVYPNSEHGFNADYRPSYDPVASKEAWAKMLAWFRTNGVA